MALVNSNDPKDMARIMAEARQLRADTMRNGFLAMKRWVKSRIGGRVTTPSQATVRATAQAAI